ncbi:hypothetical protein J2Z66_002148 [Paenibacillus eucommiae]|uniref:Uncharacterized protein n=1 Tax=Paenibacillus eucommiae TaxID=1355755 RepID=A0ABS4ISI7_9BACL|nr:hypothetical protein [Paenibacillus eucommiae]
MLPLHDKIDPRSSRMGLGPILSFYNYALSTELSRVLLRKRIISRFKR